MLKETGFYKQLKLIYEQQSKSVEVGFYEDAPKYDDGESVTNVAFHNEYGGIGELSDGPIAIPPRPFMSKSFSESKGILNASFNENKTDIVKALKETGEKVQSVIRKNILDWSTPPNSQRTIAYKGFNNPLYHTGNMVNSVRYKIAGKDES